MHAEASSDLSAQRRRAMKQHEERRAEKGTAQKGVTGGNERGENHDQRAQPVEEREIGIRDAKTHDARLGFGEEQHARGVREHEIRRKIEADAVEDFVGDAKHGDENRVSVLGPVIGGLLGIHDGFVKGHPSRVRAKEGAKADGERHRASLAQHWKRHRDSIQSIHPGERQGDDQ